MASSTTEICNLALRHLACGKEIGTLATDRSEEGAALRRFYSISLDKILRDFYWPFATKLAALGEVTSSEDDDHPTEEWAYQYQVPSDCLRFRKIQSGIRNDTRASRIPYREAYGDSGTVIYTDQADAVGEYTVRVEDVLRFPPDFVMALSRLIAHHVAPSVTRGDPFQMAKANLEAYLMEASRASANAANEEQPDELPETASINARD